jgi:hypothetical protein
VGADGAGNVYVGGTIGTGKSSRAFIVKYDPTGRHILYTKYLTAQCGAAGNALAVDPAGNVYLTGTVSAPTDLGYCGIVTDVLAAKLDPSGRVVYQDSIGPSSKDGVLTAIDNQGEAIAVDGAGNAYITGKADDDTVNPTIPTTPGALQSHDHTHVGFVMKVDSSGHLAYSTFLGGSGTIDEGKGIVVDGAGHAFVTGTTQSPDFPVTPNAYQPHLGKLGNSPNILGNAFVVELNPTGSKILYGTYLGAYEVEIGYGIATDGAGHVYVAGATGSPNYPTTSGAYDRTCGTDGNCNVHHGCLNNGCGLLYDDDVFVAELNINRSGSSALRYATFLGSFGNDEAYAMTIDGPDHVYIAGRTDSTVGFPIKNVAQAQRGGGVDAFVAEVDPALTGKASLIYCSYFGGSKDDEVQAIGLGKGAVYVTGDSGSTNYPLHGAVQMTWTGKYGAFVTALSR